MYSHTHVMHRIQQGQSPATTGSVRQFWVVSPKEVCKALVYMSVTRHKVPSTGKIVTNVWCYVTVFETAGKAETKVYDYDFESKSVRQAVKDIQRDLQVYRRVIMR